MRPDSVALGIDIGTGSTKAGLVDIDGNLVDVARASHEIGQPKPGWSESDPQDWLASTRGAVGQVLDRLAAGERRRPIVAIGFSGQMHGVVVCDEDAAPIRPAVLWSDRRSQPLLDSLGAEFSTADRELLANPVVAGMAGPTMAALAATEPQTLSSVAAVLQAKDWVRWRLTSTLATDPSDASGTLLWDVPGDRWMDRACQVFGVDRGWLPPVLPSAGPGGSLNTDGAELLGLPTGLPVAVGAADTAAALLGAGLAVGETQVSTGTGGQIARLVAGHQVARGAGTHLFRSAQPVGPTETADGSGRWYAMAAIQNAGIAIDWAGAVLGVIPEDTEEAVAASPVGSNGVSFLPYLTGERTPHLDAELSGAWSGLRPTTTRADLVRSVFEGVAFALRDALDALGTHGTARALAGGGSTAVLAGGGSTSGWWRQMLADTLEITLVPHNVADASVRGAGLLAWASVGVNVDPAAAVSRHAPIEPSSTSRPAYDRARQRFLDAFCAAAIHDRHRHRSTDTTN